MTALERAKAFVNSRAGKTALKIMPLALAAAAAVTVTPQAKADVTLTNPKAFFQGCVGMCSGGFVIDNQTDTASQVPETGFTGAVGSGNMSGHFTSSSTGTPLHFYLSGGATGTGVPNTLILSWDYNLTTPSDITVQSVAVWFTYSNGDLFGDCDATADNGGIADSCSIDLTGEEASAGPLNSWNAFFEAQTINPNGDTAPLVWDVSYLAVTSGPYPSTTPTPEPSSMLLALAGLPLIGRFVRRKR